MRHMSATTFARSHGSGAPSIHQGMAASLAHPLPETIPFTHRRQWLLLLFAGLLLAGVCCFQFSLGAFPTRIYGHDLFVFLNGAWRVASGQVPYVDFYSGLGVLVWKPIQ